MGYLLIIHTISKLLLFLNKLGPFRNLKRVQISQETIRFSIFARSHKSIWHLQRHAVERLPYKFRPLANFYPVIDQLLLSL
jgi:hypothetical protein